MPTFIAVNTYLWCSSSLQSQGRMYNCSHWLCLCKFHY